ncbi:DEAD/DEAH box helicase [Anaeromicropila populeti]|uniref:Superfamily II DNA or RNA helicase, SNF2 family n=1 Tax=Anaeromicropila populeti TaxID=37658 RepID=A0A1I6L2R3_9FIRM|nr:DEAD/DEAH box helicase [Anaeromicropila populeti]SFR97754.1 Superfamily II DNA or RNA helicase, SNF2 family [Anaeromicropila populeti]
MFKISKDTIKKLATDEATYFRGLRYYKNNAVSNVTWSKQNQQYKALVSGSNQYIVTVEEAKEGNVHYTCNCPAHIKYEGACKHVIATLLFISNYMERNETKQPASPEEKNLYQILDYFKNQDKATLVGETFRVEVTFRVPAILKGKDSRAYVSLRAGSSRLYKVQNIKKFLAGLYEKENIILGKDFKFIAGESRFTKSSQAVLDYLISIYEIQEALGKVYYNNLFAKSEIAITKSMFFKLLHAIGGEHFQIELNDELYTEVTMVKGNPPIEFSIEGDEESISIEIKDYKPVKPFVEDGSLLLYDEILYHPDKDFISNYLPFYNSFKKDTEPLTFHGELKTQFIDNVLPRIHETMDIKIPKSLENHYVKEELKIKIYLDKYKNYIKAVILFQYGAYELNPLLNNVPKGIIIVRQREKENDFFDKVDQLHFEPYQDFFVMKKDADIYEFLSKDIFELNKNYQVFHSEQLKNMKISSAGAVRTTIGFNEKIKLLELNIVYDEVPKNELKDLLESLQEKKKYYRLKDGSFISLEGMEMGQMNQLLEQLHVKEDNISEEGQVNLPAYQAVYLDQLLNEYDALYWERTTAYESLLKGILEPKEINLEVPETITATLRPYQIVGYNWLKTLADNQLAGILADDMGLGKTLQTITYIAAYLKEAPDKLHFLVVSPTSLVYNWQEEFEKFAPSIKTIIAEGTPEERAAQIHSILDNDVIITSYPLIRRDIDLYQQYSFHTMFIDEAQFIKNPSSQNAQSAKKVAAKHKFALTGTPIENSLSELWSLFDFIMPNYLYTHAQFVENYEKPIMKEGDKATLEDLGKHIQPFILRRMKKDVLKELPDKIEMKMMAEMTPEQSKVYYAYLESMKQQLSMEINKNGFEKSRIQILAALTRLRQICCHPATFIENFEGESGKLNLLTEVVSEILENGHRILVFSQFTSMLEIISNELKRQEIDYFYLSGKTKPKERKDYVNRFNDGEGSVFLISLKAGGTGLNLVGADVVIHYDPWWNPAVEEQATDRAYRIGQEKSVQVLKLLTKNTIEEKIDRLQKKKKQLSNSVIQAKEIFISQLTQEELEELFR